MAGKSPSTTRPAAGSKGTGKTHQEPTEAKPARDSSRIPGQGVGGHAKPGKPEPGKNR